MIRAVVFDFDGVLANSEPLHFAAFRDVLAEKGVPFDAGEYYASYLGYSDLDLFHVLSRNRGLSWDRETVTALVRRKAVRFEELEAQGAIFFPGAQAAVERLSASFPLAIASGAIRPEIVRVLNRANLMRCFRAIVTAEDTPAGKPAPDPYVAAVKRLSDDLGEPLKEAECVAIEDSRWGLDSARAAGLRTIAVTHTYQASSLSDADVVIDNLHDLTVERIAEM